MTLQDRWHSWSYLKCAAFYRLGIIYITLQTITCVTEHSGVTQELDCETVMFPESLCLLCLWRGAFSCSLCNCHMSSGQQNVYFYQLFHKDGNNLKKSRNYEWIRLTKKNRTNSQQFVETYSKKQKPYKCERKCLFYIRKNGIINIICFRSLVSMDSPRCH